MMNKFCLELFSLSILICVLFISTACSRRDDTAQTKRSLQEIRLVISPEVHTEIAALVQAFIASKPMLSDGLPLKIELIKEPSLSAAKKIAAGELKTHAWLTPSLSLINFTNTHLSNLGPQQGQCQQLFGSPVVVATAQKVKANLSPNSQQFSWKEFFDPRIEDSSSSKLRTSFVHSMPLSTTSGLAALSQLAYLSAFKLPATLDLDTLKAETTAKRLIKYQDFVSSYYFDDQILLEKLLNSDSSGVFFGLSIEQQLALFNQGKAGSSSRLVALYPKEGSYWVNYNLCISEADWVSPANRAGIKLLTDFLSSERSQFYLKSRGFRPASLALKDVAPLTPEFGVDLSLPTSSFLPVPGEVLSHLIDSWPSIAKPMASLVVFDGSGSMEDVLGAGKQVLRNWVANTSARDRKALLSFNADVQEMLGFSSDTVRYIQTIDQLRSVGGSALYDAIKRSIDLISDKEIKDFRKYILIFTDGSDKNSQISLELLTDLLRQKSGSEYINFFIVAVSRPDVDNSNLRKLAREAGGEFRESAPEMAAATLQSAFEQLR